MFPMRNPSPATPTDSSLSPVDAYLAQVPEPARTTLNKIRATIRATVPEEATEKISYGMPAFQYKGPLIGYAAFKDHCSVFPMNAGLIVEFANELRQYSTAKGTIRFPVDQPMKLSLLKKIVKARILQNEAKQKR